MQHFNSAHKCNGPYQSCACASKHLPPRFSLFCGYSDERQAVSLHVNPNESPSNRLKLTVREGKRIAVSVKAADWFVRVGDASVSSEDRSRYLSWLKQSPMHVAETLRLLHMCGLLRSMARRQSGETPLETSQQVS
jgi:hypothetical protein